jgi:cysteine synthase
MTSSTVAGTERAPAASPAYDHAVRHFHDAAIRLPTFAELADPSTIDAGTMRALAAVDPDAPNPHNLFRVHWWNDHTRRGRAAVPEHVVLPESLTGVAAPIVVVFGDRFPLIHAHKVLAAYACLAPRIVTGQFDPTTQRAVWPSTGNYCRGGVAISRILGCRGVAVLPEGMSEERFRWLARWVGDPSDIIRTPGTESNVKEIHDRCDVLARDPALVVLDQFREFANHLVHATCTAPALSAAFEAARRERPALRLAAFVSASGSAGTLGAGDPLKERHGARIVAAEALECPTLLENGFGEHNIQGIGDKHVPLIHNVMNTDLVAAISDAATDGLFLVFNSDEGRQLLTHRHGVPQSVVASLAGFGLSSICNVVAAAKTAKRLGLGADDAIVTVATDGAAMYGSEVAKILAKRYAHGWDSGTASETFARHMLGAGEDHVLELTHAERTRIFNLGYYTWVEQRGVALELFERRRQPEFWAGLRSQVPAWDALIREFNRRTGCARDGD